MQRGAVVHDDAPARKLLKALATPFERDFSPRGSVRRAIRQRRIEFVAISGCLQVPLSEAERIEAKGPIARLAGFSIFRASIGFFSCSLRT
jgi:amino acid permease